MLAIVSDGGSVLLGLVLALLLGLRHASDPDHLAALSTLVASDDERGPRRAGWLGLAWGAGHAVTLVALGLPAVLFNGALPGWAQAAAEGVVGAVIVGLAVRLLVAWRRGRFEARPRAQRPGRSARAAFGVGLVHGAGGSAGVGILLVAGVDGDVAAVIALLLFAAGTAVSMATASAAWGRLLVTSAVERRLSTLAPAFGTASLAFGCWYGLAAFGLT